MVGCPRNRISSSSRACRTAGSTKLRPELAVRRYGTKVDWRGYAGGSVWHSWYLTNVGCVGPSFIAAVRHFHWHHTIYLRGSRPPPTVMLQRPKHATIFVPQGHSQRRPEEHDRRRTDDLAIEGTREDWPRRRSNPDAARPQPRTERGRPSGSAPSSPRAASSCGGRPPDEGADARGPRRPLGRRPPRLDAAGPPVGPRPQPFPRSGSRMTAIRGSNATVTDSLASLGPDDRLRLKQRTR